MLVNEVSNLDNQSAAKLTVLPVESQVPEVTPYILILTSPAAAAPLT